MKNYVIVNNSTDMLYLSVRAASGYNTVYTFSKDISGENVVILGYDEAIDLYSKLKSKSKQYEQIKVCEIYLKEIDVERHLRDLNKFKSIENELALLSKIVTIKREMLNNVQSNTALTYDMSVVAAAHGILKQAEKYGKGVDEFLHTQILVFKDGSSAFNFADVRQEDSVFKVDAQFLKWAKIIHKHKTLFEGL